MIHIDTSLVVQRCCATRPMNLSKAYHWNFGRRSPCLLVCSLSIPDMCNISCTLPRIGYDMHFLLCPLESLKSTLNSFKEINQNRNYTTQKNLQKWISIYSSHQHTLDPLQHQTKVQGCTLRLLLRLVFGATKSFSKSIQTRKRGKKWLKFLMKLRFIHCSLGPNNIGFFNGFNIIFSFHHNQRTTSLCFGCFHFFFGLESHVVCSQDKYFAFIYPYLKKRKQENM